MSGYNFVNTDASDIYSTILSKLETEVSEPLYPGDERRIFSEAIIYPLLLLFENINYAGNQVLLSNASGEVLDALGERYGIYRIAATKATTTVRFNVGMALDSDVFIPQGTRVTGDGVKYFYTSEAATLKAGALYIDVVCEAEEGGTDYNGYIVGTITTLSDVIGYIASISNIDESSGGDDGEPYTTAGDDHFRERIQLAPASFGTGTEGAYEYHTKSADSSVIDVAVVMPSDGCVDIYPLMTGGVVPTEDEIAGIQAVVSDSKNRALTDKVTVKVPTQISYDIEIEYYMNAADETAIVEAIEGDGGAIAQYQEWQCAKLGRAINPDTLRKYIFNAGADRVIVTSPTFTEIAVNEVAVFSGTIKISHGTM